VENSTLPPQPIIDEFVGNAHGNYIRVKELLDQYPYLLNASASWKETAIEAAAQTGNVEIMNYLLSRGAPMDICTAAVLGLNRKVAELLESEPGLVSARGAHGIPVLYYPVIRGFQEIAELLLENGADPNAGEGSTTPLHGAVLFGKPNMAKWLLFHGASPQAKDYDGKTPLDRARERGDAEMESLLTT
jgi:uncharacterized protein